MGSKRMEKVDCDTEWCPIEAALSVIGGMWKVIIIRELMTGTKRYSQLHRGLKSVTHKMLAQQLRELERDRVIHRKVYPVVPPKVEYSLTPLGKDLDTVLRDLQRWGKKIYARRGKEGLSAAAA